MITFLRLHVSSILLLLYKFIHRYIFFLLIYLLLGCASDCLCYSFFLVTCNLFLFIFISLLMLQSFIYSRFVCLMWRHNDWKRVKSHRDASCYCQRHTTTGWLSTIQQFIIVLLVFRFIYFCFRCHCCFCTHYCFIVFFFCFFVLVTGVALRILQLNYLIKINK